MKPAPAIGEQVVSDRDRPTANVDFAVFVRVGSALAAFDKQAVQLLATIIRCCPSEALRVTISRYGRPQRHTMPYNGEQLEACGVIEIDLREIEIVAVSGSGPNACGHLLLHTLSRGGYYFHVAEVRGVPRYMTPDGFRRYVRENHKSVLRRIKLELPNPSGAEAYLEQLLAEIWWWRVIPNNCVAFCEEVIQAGELDWGSYSNCPTLAADVPQQEVGNFLRRIDAYLRYGRIQ